MTTPTMKMTTEIPAQITTPDSVETRIGTLKFFDGFRTMLPSFCSVDLYASPKCTLTGRGIETTFVRKSGQKQDRRSDGEQEITF